MAVSGRLSQFSAAKTPFQLIRRDVPDPKPGAVVVKVTACNICGSDLHAWNGHFQTTALGGKLPTVLGHEMIGRVAALGAGVTADTNGQPLAVDDRVIYTYFSVCGRCPACLKGQRVSCQNLKMAMLDSIDEWPIFVGGYADYFYLHPGAAIYKVPDDIADELAAGANCALSQVLYGFMRSGLTFGETVIVQGAGGLGVYACAVAKAFGAASVIVIDGVAERLDLAKRFGADHAIDITALPEEKARAKQIRQLTGGRGADVVMELVGQPGVLPEGIKLTGLMGRYVLIGNINAGQSFALDPSRLVMGNKSLIGVSLYEPQVLGMALAFIQRNAKKLPFGELLSRKFPLEDINQAFDLAMQRKIARASIVL